MRAALDAGITTFDTADVYANTAAETVLGEALKGERRESLEIFTKVYWPTGPGGHNDSGLSRKHIMESINGSLKRLQTDYVDLYQAHRYDTETPLEETMQAFADVVRQGKALYIGVSEWTADQIRAGHALAQRAGRPAGLEPAAVLDAVARHRGARSCRPASELGISPDRLVAGRAGRAHRQVPARAAAARRARAPPTTRAARDMIQRLHGRRRAGRACSGSRPIADELGLTMAQLAVAWVLQNQNVACAIIGASRPEQVTENVKASGVVLTPEVHGADRRRARRRRRARPDADGREQPQGPTLTDVHRRGRGASGTGTARPGRAAATAAPCSSSTGRRTSPTTVRWCTRPARPSPPPRSRSRSGRAGSALDDRIVDLLPETWATVAEPSESVAQLTVHHVLSMSTGHDTDVLERFDPAAPQDWARDLPLHPAADPGRLPARVQQRRVLAAR